MSGEHKSIHDEVHREVTRLPEKRKTKIDFVREQLRANPEVHFAGEVHHYHSDAPERGYWTETVDIIISRVNPIFNAGELNAFMDSLIADIEAFSRDGARERGDGGFELGKLHFDEVIGSIQTVTVTTIESSEPETLLRADRVVGELRTETNQVLRRKTKVRVYPDSVSASLVAEYEQGVENGSVDPDSSFSYAEHWLDGKQVEELKAKYSSGNPVSKISGFLKRK